MATQKGRNWSSGDIVTAANLRSVERGVSEVAEEYTPTTWANGDTVTAAALNNIEQGIANAGGGSSDFSTAEVTLINNSGSNTAVIIPACYEAFPPIEPNANINGFASLTANESATLIVPIYKNGVTKIYSGEANDRLQGVSMGKTLTVTSGSATLDGSNWAYITGDCTITISNSSGGDII